MVTTRSPPWTCTTWRARSRSLRAPWLLRGHAHRGAARAGWPKSWSIGPRAAARSACPSAEAGAFDLCTPVESPSTTHRPPSRPATERHPMLAVTAAQVARAPDAHSLPEEPRSVEPEPAAPGLILFRDRAAAWPPRGAGPVPSLPCRPSGRASTITFRCGQPGAITPGPSVRRRRGRLRPACRRACQIARPFLLVARPAPAGRTAPGEILPCLAPFLRFAP